MPQVQDLSGHHRKAAVHARVKAIAPLSEVARRLRVAGERVLDAEPVLAIDGVRHVVIGAAAHRVLVQADLVEEFPAHGPAVAGVAMQVVATARQKTQVSRGYRGEGFDSVGYFADEVVPFEPQCGREELRHRVRFQKLDRIDSPVLVQEQDVAVKPRDVATAPGEPGCREVEKPLLLPEQGIAPHADDVRSFWKLELFVTKGALDHEQVDARVSHGSGEDVVGVPARFVPAGVVVGRDDP